jgi:hypothetical protein
MHKKTRMTKSTTRIQSTRACKRLKMRRAQAVRASSRKISFAGASLLSGKNQPEAKNLARATLICENTAKFLRAAVAVLRRSRRARNADIASLADVLKNLRNSIRNALISKAYQIGYFGSPLVQQASSYESACRLLRARSSTKT